MIKILKERTVRVPDLILILLFFFSMLMSPLMIAHCLSPVQIKAYTLFAIVAANFSQEKPDYAA